MLTADCSSAIELTAVTAGYGGAPVLRDLSLRVPAGRFVGLIGPSGAGKTSLLRTMLGTLPTASGAVMIDGRSVGPGRPPSGVGYVPQVETVDWSFPVTVEDVVLMGRVRRMGSLPWPSRTDRRAVLETLEGLGIAHLRRRHIRNLSGGQQQRTFLARALVGRPRILLLDEPTASVDVRTRDDILHLLVSLNRQGITIVMSTHELSAVAAHLPWVICVNGGIIAQGPPEAVFMSPMLGQTFGTEMRVVRDPETGALLVAEVGMHGALGAVSGQRSAISGQHGETHRLNGHEGPSSPQPSRERTCLKDQGAITMAPLTIPTQSKLTADS